MAEFLRGVCLAIADLPLDRLAVEVDVLRTEDGVVAAPAVGALLAERYGARGVGLAGFRDLALRALTEQDVQEWAGSRFVRGNAAVWLTGPVPEGLSLPLPDGGAPQRPSRQLRELRTPALVEHPVDGAVALGGEVARLTGLGAALRILRDRVEDDLRHRRGLSYTVGSEQVLVDADRRFAVLTADCRDGQEAVAARALWQGLVRLADEGATAAELDHDRDGLTDYLEDPRSAVAEVHAAAVDAVTGIPHRTADELRRESLALTGEQVRTAAAALRDGALLGVPTGVEVALPGLTPLPQWSSDVVRGRDHGRRLRGSEAPRGARLVVGEDGVSVVLRDAEQLTVRYRDAAGLLQVGPQEWTLVGVDGFSVPLAPADWKDGEQAVAAVRAAVPTHLQVSVDSSRSAARRVLLLHAPAHAATEALWPSSLDADVVRSDRWTLVVREQDEVETYAEAAGMSASLGRDGAVLLLELAYDELTAVLVHRGKERDRHVWTGERHDPSVLSGVLGVDPEQLADLLAHPGRPAEVLAALTAELGIPEQTAQVLAGGDPAEVPGFVHESARGMRQTIAAAARGEYDAPDSTRVLDRMVRWERERTPRYRVANAVSAGVQLAVAGVLATRVDGDWSSWTGALTLVFGLSGLGSVWSTRPPQR